MNSKYIKCIVIILSTLGISACGIQLHKEEKTVKSTQSIIEEVKKDIPNIKEDRAIEREVITEKNEAPGDAKMQGIIIEVGGQSFQITLYDNNTVEELKNKLPMTLPMDELNGNEKFYYLEEGLPTNPEYVGSIQAGDILLFGSDCLVIFFKDYNTSYSYTRIGHINDAQGFVASLIGGSVEIFFRIEE